MHVLSDLLLIYICKLHWNLNTMFVCQVNLFLFTYVIYRDMWAAGGDFVALVEQQRLPQFILNCVFGDADKVRASLESCRNEEGESLLIYI